MEGTNPRSSTNYFIQTASFAAFGVAIYFDSVVDCVTTLYLELYHETAPQLMMKTYPNSILQSYRYVWKLAYV